MDRQELKAAIERGIRVLDRSGPSRWYERIDVSILDMYNAECCVLGQVYGSYKLGLNAVIQAEGIICPENYAFTDPRLLRSGGLYTTPELNKLWQQRLTRLQHERDELRQPAPRPS